MEDRLYRSIESIDDTSEPDFECAVSLDLYNFNKLGEVSRLLRLLLEDSKMSRIKQVYLLNKAIGYVLEAQQDLVIEQVYSALNDKND